MSAYNIRQYKDSDYEMIREFYSWGVWNHTPIAFKQALQAPHVWILLTVAFFVPLKLFGSILLSMSAVAALLIFLYLCAREIFQAYVRDAFTEDLQDINRYYLQRDGYGFWVAESAGQVVGTVAVTQSIYARGEKHLELTRMSVAKSQRRKGVAQALCRTVIDIARQRGYDVVILLTTSANVDAHHLYKRMGFRKVHKFYHPKLIGKLIGLTLIIYRYDIPPSW